MARKTGGRPPKTETATLLKSIIVRAERTSDFVKGHRMKREYALFINRQLREVRNLLICIHRDVTGEI